ncbi:hypothetical protein LZ30DRAFT_717736 [Colletotrichum cereale]|nr:hypothetical protein LZ30DRAFT_717736 [Colletotrichum cereale]
MHCNVISDGRTTCTQDVGTLTCHESKLGSRFFAESLKFHFVLAYRVQSLLNEKTFQLGHLFTRSVTAWLVAACAYTWQKRGAECRVAVRRPFGLWLWGDAFFKGDNLLRTPKALGRPLDPIHTRLCRALSPVSGRSDTSHSVPGLASGSGRVRAGQGQRKTW